MNDNRCIDLFSGTRSATKYFALNGWEVDYVDMIDGRDVREYHAEPSYFLWASPPCQEYSYFNRKFSTWESKYRTDDTLWLETFRVIKEAKPRYWIIENVKGAQQRWGKAPFHYGSYFMWGYFPFERLPVVPWTTSLKGTHADRSVKTTKNGGLHQWDEGRSAESKAMIPDALAKAVYDVVQVKSESDIGGRR